MIIFACDGIQTSVNIWVFKLLFQNVTLLFHCFRYKNGNGDTISTNSSTQTTQIDGPTEFNQQSEDVGDAFGGSL